MSPRQRILLGAGMILLALLLAAVLGRAHAQGSPGAIPGQILTDGTGRLTGTPNGGSAFWLNNAFSQKQNYNAMTNCIAQLLSPTANSFPMFNGDGTCQIGSFGTGLSVSGGVVSATSPPGGSSVAISTTGTIAAQAALLVLWDPSFPTAAATFLLTATPLDNYCQTFVNASQQGTYPMILAGGSKNILPASGGPPTDSLYSAVPGPVRVCYSTATGYWSQAL